VCTRYAERVHESGQFRCHLVEGEFALYLVARAGTALIVRNDPKTFTEERKLWLPVSGNAAQTAHENKRIAPSNVFIIDLAVRNGRLWHV
jgi:hypothetical protein